MKEITFLTIQGIKNILRFKNLVAILLGVVLICVAGLTVAFSIFLISPALEAEVPDRAALELYTGMIVFAVSLIGVGVTLNVFGFQIMVREKSRGNIMALLATPLKTVHVWMGKSLAAFLPGMVMGVIFALISLLAINFAYLVPVTGFLLNPWSAVSAVVGVPMVYLSMSLLVHIIGLTGKPATGNVIVQIFLPALLLTINLGSSSGAGYVVPVIHADEPGAGGDRHHLRYTLQRLTRERIVLSNGSLIWRIEHILVREFRELRQTAFG